MKDQLPHAHLHDLGHIRASWAKGVDIATIALWLGHETTQTTRIYENSRELHQTGEKPQVPMSGRYSSGFSRVHGMAA
jgi:integrase